MPAAVSTTALPLPAETAAPQPLAVGAVFVPAPIAVGSSAPPAKVAAPFNKARRLGFDVSGFWSRLLIVRPPGSKIVVIPSLAMLRFFLYQSRAFVVDRFVFLF